VSDIRTNLDPKIGSVFDDQRPMVFISSTESDRDIASKISAALTARGLNVFNFADIDLGEVWAERVSKAIRKADLILVLVSKHWNSSYWSLAELAVAFEQEKQTRIVPVRLDKAAPIPPVLLPYQYFDLSRDPADPGEIGRLATAVDEALRRPEIGSNAAESSLNEIDRAREAVRNASTATKRLQTEAQRHTLRRDVHGLLLTFLFSLVFVSAISGIIAFTDVDSKLPGLVAAAIGFVSGIASGALGFLLAGSRRKRIDARKGASVASQ
jgi:hypothetical protein